MRKTPRDVPGFALTVELRAEIQRAGYYPALVADVVATALAGDAVEAHLVHQETTFDQDSVRRHITVLAATASKLVVVHADDHDDDEHHHHERSVATATCESIPLNSVRGVMVAHVVSAPGSYVPGSLGREITLTIGWGAVSRLDLMPASCGDPNCEADHGFDGTLAADDISLRISAAADGDAALAGALHFAATLTATLGR